MQLGARVGGSERAGAREQDYDLALLKSVGALDLGLTKIATVFLCHFFLSCYTIPKGFCFVVCVRSATNPDFNG